MGWNKTNQEVILKVKDRKLVLFGEVHGTREIPERLSNLFRYIAKDEDFNLCLEISEEFQNIELYKLLSLAKETGTSGLISEEYITLIKKLPANIKVFFIAPSQIKNQEEMEKGIAENILKVVDGKKTFAILGSIHASKNKITMGNLKIVPAGFLIYQKLKDKMCSILLKAKSGEFFDNGVKQVILNEDESFDKNFDYLCEFDNVSPCSF